MSDCTYCLNYRYLQNAAGDCVRCPGCPTFTPKPQKTFEQSILAAIRAIKKGRKRLGGKPMNERKAV